MEDSKFNILSFDGGGIRGSLSIELFNRITEEVSDVYEKTDLIGGTSTGSLIALGLAYGLSAEEVKKLYSVENSKFIFKDEHTELLRPKYNNDNLKKVLMDIFPSNFKLKDLKKMVVIPSFYVGNKYDQWRPVFFNNMANSNTAEYNVIDVAMASSASPVYFPVYNRYIDGGIVAGDPSLSCIVYAIDSILNVRLEDINLLSIGTGFEHNSIEEDPSNWGAIDWLINKNISFPILSVPLEGNSMISQHFSHKILKGKYYRLNPTLDRKVGLDNANALEYLNSVAENYDLYDVLSWLDSKW